MALLGAANWTKGVRGRVVQYVLVFNNPCSPFVCLAIECPAMDHMDPR
jgi:hypothetical protein